MLGPLMGQNSSHFTAPCLLSSGNLIQIPKARAGLGGPEGDRNDRNDRVLEVRCLWEGNERWAAAWLKSLCSAQRRPPDWGAREEGCGGLHVGPDPLRLEVSPGMQQSEQDFGRRAAATPGMALF